MLRNRNTQIRNDSRVKPAPLTSKATVTAFILGGRLDTFIQQKYINLLAGPSTGLVTKPHNHTE
jgi:aconitase A